MPRDGRTMLCLCLCGALVACTVDPLSVVDDPLTDDDSALPDTAVDAAVDRDAGATDGANDADGCVATTEICDELDNDCNGAIDDVDAAALTDDVENCGTCGKACAIPNAFAKCEAGSCAIDTCAPGHINANDLVDDGCEYACVPSNEGSEACAGGEPGCACDNRDNDCNGIVDDGFDLTKDINNCGACGNRCAYNNALAVCVAGKCALSECAPGFGNTDGLAATGCEYSCPVVPPTLDEKAAAITCDGVDNDCDGDIDEDFAAAPCGSATGECVAGAQTCIAGNVFCHGATGPAAERCNSKDDDCDGSIDNGFDKQGDPRYCGDCTPCALTHALANCSGGTCGIAVCENGWVDLDGVAATGCEYECTVTGPEICDGLDNDCNGVADLADANLVPLDGNPCVAVGPCSGSSASCQGTLGWVCGYPSTIELLSCTDDADCGGIVACTNNVCPGLITPDESRCDAVDNDCDGAVDEPFTNKGTACAEQGKQGVCQGTGSFACTADGMGTECDITSAGISASDELCNGKDDDCDGLTDEESDNDDGNGFAGVTDAMVHVNRTVDATAYDFYIYAYEAARPDATSAGVGSSTARACSKASVLPWANVTFASASAACVAAGKRLCSADEWRVACEGAAETTYPYGNSYAPTSCNGVDRGSGAAVATGSIGACVGGEAGLFDMSGNLREWTDDQAGTTAPPDNTPIYVVRGGAYHTPWPGLACRFTASQAVGDVILPAIGFRCCSDSAP